MVNQPKEVSARPEPNAAPWRAIGTRQGKGTEVLYVFEVDGEVRPMRQAVLASLGGVMSLDPNADRWRAMFPVPGRAGRFDLPAIVGFLMQQCRVAQKAAAAASSDPAEPLDSAIAAKLLSEHEK
jgi:hypothetical protein